MATGGLPALDGNPDAAVSPGRASVFTVGTQDGALSPSRAGVDSGAQQAGSGVPTAVPVPSHVVAGAASPDSAIQVDAGAQVTRQTSGGSESEPLEQHLLQPDLHSALGA